MHILTLYLSLSIVFCGFLYPDVSSLTRIAGVTPMKCLSSNYGAFLLASAKDTVSIYKLDSQSTSVLWTYTNTFQNHATAVDFSIGPVSLWVILNVSWNHTESLPNLQSPVNPRLGTSHGLLLSIDTASGNAESSLWLGSCFGADSYLTSIVSINNGYMVSGGDNCSPGIWLGGNQWGKYIVTTGGFSAPVLAASDSNIYLTSGVNGDIAGISIGQQNASLPVLLKLTPSGNVLWGRILSSGKGRFSSLIAAATINPLTSFDYVAVASIGQGTVLRLFDDSGTSQWSLSLSVSMLAGMILNPGKGLVLTTSNTLIWFSYDSVQRISRTYSGGMIQGPPAAVNGFNEILLAFFSSNNSGNSTIVVSGTSPFSVSNCVNVCSHCFGPESDTCFDCNSYLSAPFTCGVCDSACSSCFGPGRFQCSGCVGNYTLSGTLCVLDLKCGLGRFTDQDSMRCQSCDKACQTCVGPGAANCTVCADGYMENGRLCVAECPSYSFNSSGTCVDCELSCAECNGPTSSNCTACTSPFVLYQETCIQTCPIGSYQLNSTCYACSEGCGHCLSSAPGNCSDCLVGFFKLGNACFRTCPDTFAGVNGLCVACPKSCGKCSNTTVCDQCLEGFFWNVTKCSPIPTCPNGTFFSGSGCVHCSGNCESCWGTGASQCTHCVPGYFLRNSTCSEPISICPPDSYLTSNNTCTLCPSNCTNCTSPQMCGNCLSGLLLVGGVCLTECPSNMYKNGSVCEDCGEACSQCDFKGECRECSDTYFLSGGKCVPMCPANSLPSSTGECVSCASNCIQCNSTLNGCMTCSSGFYLSGKQCFQCPETCKSCLSLETCSACSLGFLLYNDTCQSTCPLGTAGLYGVCQPCEDGCEECDSPRNCTLCQVSVSQSGRFRLQTGVCDLSSIDCYPGFNFDEKVGFCLDENAKNTSYSRSFILAALSLVSV